MVISAQMFPNGNFVGTEKKKGSYVLSAIRRSDSIKVLARYSSKAEGPFYCPYCFGELNIRKGRIKVHHFAHKPPVNCTHGEGETEAHRKCKETIFNCLSKRSNVTELEIEKNLGTVIPDIYAKINNIPVAIEVQRSNLSVNTITEKTQRYYELGIHVLWIAIFHEKLNNERYSPKAWEKWCHAAYFGRVYYWVTGLTILPVHFAEYQLYVEPSSWYESGGYERSGGDYYRSSKRYRTPQPGRQVNITENFQPNFRMQWKGGSIDIPTCNLYSDNQRVWWKK